MAEDATTAKGETDDPPLIIVDGSSNTIVLEEDAAGANSQSPNAPPTTANRPGLTVVVAERDPETGEVTLVEGKSTEGDGRIQISGTDRIFEDQAAFEEFLAEVNGKADAGVPFEDILGTDANAIPVVENGVATGETLGDVEDGATPGEIVEVPPPSNGNPGAAPDGAAAETPPPGFSSGAEGTGRREGDRDPDGPGDGTGPSANGNAGNRIVPERNQDGFERLLGEEDDSLPPTGPEDGERQPGREENGNLLPGAEGQVTLDDFNRINDLDGNGINDGIENPVDLAGEREDDAPRFEPPPLRIVEPAPPFGTQDPGQPIDPGGDGSPEPPGGGIDIVVDPAPPHANPDDGVLPGDGLGVVRDPDAPLDVRNPEPPDEPAAPADLPVNQQPSAPPAVDVAAPPPPAPPHTVPPSAAAVDAAPPTNAPADGALLADAPAAVAADAYTPSVSLDGDPAAVLDNFHNGTAPSAPAVLEPLPATNAPASAVSPHEPPASAVQEGTVAAEDCPPDEETGPGLAASVASAAALAPVGAALAATDVFDQDTVVASAVSSGTSEEGEGNLLERIFEKVKDVLFDSGGPEPSPVQLPVQADITTPALPVPADPSFPEPVAAADFDTSPLPEDAVDDTF